MKPTSLFLCLFLFWQSLVSTVFAHNSIIYPCPRFSEAGIDCPDKLPEGEELTDEENYPIYSKEDKVLQPLCKYTAPWPGTKVRWSPGQEVTVKFNSWSVSHSGGHCQFSISYDNGKTFAVIHEVLQYCFVGSKPKDYTEEVSVYDYTFTLPDLPASDTAVFAWTWVAAVGNREFFMNCADIIIENSEFESYTGKNITIANYPGYPTIPEFEMDYDTGLEYYRAPYIQNSTVTPGTTFTSKKSSGGSSPNVESLSDNIESINSSFKQKSPKALNSPEDNNDINSDLVSSDEFEDEEKCDDGSDIQGNTDKNIDENIDNNTDENTDGNTDKNIGSDFEYVCDTGDTEATSTEGTEGNTESDDGEYVCDDGNTEDTEGTEGTEGNAESSEIGPTGSDTSEQANGLPVLGDGEPDYACDDEDEDEDEDTEDVIDILNSIASEHSLTIEIVGNESSNLSSELPSPTSDEASPYSESDIGLESPSPTSEESSSSSSSFVLFEYSSPQSISGSLDSSASSETVQIISSPVLFASSSSEEPLYGEDTSVMAIISIVSIA